MVSKAYYLSLIVKVSKAKPAHWARVGIDCPLESSKAEYASNRWSEFTKCTQEFYQLKPTKKNFPFLASEWLRRKHFSKRGKRGADHCGKATIRNWAHAISKGFFLATTRSKTKIYPGLMVQIPNWNKICREVSAAVPLRRAGEPKYWLKEKDFIQQWIKVFRGRPESDFARIQDLSDGQYTACHDKLAYTTCTRGGELTKQTRVDDEPYNRTHLGLYHDNFHTQIFSDSSRGFFDLSPSGLGRKAAAPQGPPEGVIGWLDRQKNEKSVSGEVHNKFYYTLTDKIPDHLVARHPCLAYCTNRFVFNLLMQTKTSRGDTSFAPQANGIRPLFPPKSLCDEIDRVTKELSEGASFHSEVVKALFVNEEKSWFDKVRKETFRGLVADHNLKHVSGHCWRGGQMSHSCSCRKSVSSDICASARSVRGFGQLSAP